LQTFRDIFVILLPHSAMYGTDYDVCLSDLVLCQHGLTYRQNYFTSL